jgi:cytochrome c biogenesis protein CcmG, thiol:disulfide interchange protein DsbE
VSTRALVAFIGAAAVVALLGYGLLTEGEANLAVGEAVPDKELPTLDGGDTGSIADYRGRWVLVNLWASWCLPCREESPTLQRFHERNRDRGVTVLGVNVQDNSDDARAFVREYGLTYPQLRSVGDERSEAFGSTGVPENFLVDPAGDLALIRRGPVDDRFLGRFVFPLVEEKQ